MNSIQHPKQPSKRGNMNEQDLMTVKQAARELDFSEMHVRKLADNGTLKGIRVPNGPRLLDRKSVEHLAEQRRTANPKK